MKILGKDVSKEEIAKLYAKKFLGNTDKNIQPMKVVAIGRELGHSSPDTQYKYMNLAAEMKLLKKIIFDEVNQKTGKVRKVTRFVKPEVTYQQQFSEFSKDHKIMNDPIIADWFEDMASRKKGKGIGSRFRHVAIIEKICNTCRVTPSQIISSNSTAEEIKKNFMKAFREHAVWGQINYNRSIETLDYELSYAIASLCDVHGIKWNKNSSKMSRQIVGHGDHADIRLTPEEFEEADRYLIEKHGIDSDIYRIFWVGVESCARHKALYTMPLIFTKSTSKKTGKITYFLEAVETKASHINGGKWTKFIKRTNTQKSLDLLRDRGSKYIWENPQNLKITNFKAQIRVQLLELYEHLGKITNREELEREKKEKKLTKTGNYWLDHYTHTLRHVGAHYWLGKTKYNYGFVAKIGGWNIIDELKKSYGEMPPEMAMEILEDVDSIENHGVAITA